MAMCRRVCGQATEEDAGKGEWKKEPTGTYHAILLQGTYFLYPSITILDIKLALVE